ncbi:MAG TPA: TolC family protein [Longimicrobiaceae bacterium]|nr:TolC family protein [Longimicrobiaceae bacterium]
MFDDARPSSPRSRVLALAVLLALLPFPLAAQQPASPETPTSLSLDQAIRLAQDNNPTFQATKNDLTVADAQVRAAYGSLLPSADVSTGFGYTAKGQARYGSVEFGQQPDYYSSNYSLSFGYQLSGATLLQPSLSKAQRRATERTINGASADLASQVTQQYLALLQAREQIDQAQKEVARTEEHLKLAQAKLDVGSGTPLEVRQAEVEKGQADVALVKAKNDADLQALALGQVTGLPLDPGVQLTTHFEVFEPKLDPNELVKAALEHNPSLLSSRANVDAAQTGVKAARTAYLPSLSFRLGWTGSVYQAGDINPLVQQDLGQLQASFQSCNSMNALYQASGLPLQDCSGLDVSNPALVEQVRQNERDRNSGFPFDYTRQPMQFSVGISLPIFQGFSRRLQLDRAKAQAEDARYQVRADQLQLRQQVTAGVRNLQAAYQTVLLDRQVRASAAEELRLAQERFRFGAANSIEVTDAQTKLSQAEKDEIAAVYDFHKTLAALEALVGQPLR